jgi:hypothetical protein
MDAPKNNNICFVPCGHRNLCRPCADQFVGAPNGCPICRKVVQQVMVLY